MSAFSAVSWLDLLFAATLLAGTLLGASAGIKRLLFWLVHYGLALAATIYLYRPARQFAWSHLPESQPVLSHLVSLVGTFIVVYLCLWACFYVIRRAFFHLVLRRAEEQINRAIDATGLRPLDRLLGGAAGAAMAFVPLSLLLTALYFDPHQRAAHELEQSLVGPPAVRAISAVVEAVPQHHKDRIVRSTEVATNSFISGLGRYLGKLLDNLSDQIEHAGENTPVPDGSGDDAVQRELRKLVDQLGKDRLGKDQHDQDQLPDSQLQE